MSIQPFFHFGNHTSIYHIPKFWTLAATCSMNAKVSSPLVPANTMHSIILCS
jgi:hypothetical protein